MNKKGFVLVETLIVVIFVLLIFTILYNSAVPLLGKYMELSHYNDLDATYDLYYYKKLLVNDSNYLTITSNSYKLITCSDLNLANDCIYLKNATNIKGTDSLVFINLQTLNRNTFNNDLNISNEIKDYLKHIDDNSKILLLEHDGYLSYIKLD